MPTEADAAYRDDGLRPGGGAPPRGGRRAVALLLAGHGAQRPGMATALYGWEPAFTAAMDETFESLGRVGDRVRADWLAAVPEVPIDDARRAHPLLFGIGYAMGRMLESWGVQVSVLLGHSIGELAAAVLADIVDLRSAVRFLLRRTRLFAQAPVGGMYAVAAGAEALAPFLRDGVVIGGYNGPRQVLLSGPEPALGSVLAELEAAGLTCRSSRAEHGFHSPSLAAACAWSLPWFEAVRLRRPRIPVISGVLGIPLTPEHAVDPEYWAMAPARPVRFGPALDLLLSQGDFVLVDGGPSRWISAMARRHPAVSSGASTLTALLAGRRSGPEGDRNAVAGTADVLRREGHRVHRPWTDAAGGTDGTDASEPHDGTDGAAPAPAPGAEADADAAD